MEGEPHEHGDAAHDETRQDEQYAAQRPVERQNTRTVVHALVTALRARLAREIVVIAILLALYVTCHTPCHRACFRSVTSDTLCEIIIVDSSVMLHHQVLSYSRNDKPALHGNEQAQQDTKSTFKAAQRSSAKTNTVHEKR